MPKNKDWAGTDEWSEWVDLEEKCIIWETDTEQKYHAFMWNSPFPHGCKECLWSPKIAFKTVTRIVCGNCCLCKTAVNSRLRVLEGDMSKYKLFQVLLNAGP